MHGSQIFLAGVTLSETEHVELQTTPSFLCQILDLWIPMSRGQPFCLCTAGRILSGFFTFLRLTIVSDP